MRPDGTETLCIWREAGEWWEGANPREVRRYIDQRGVRREQVRNLDGFGSDSSDVMVRRLRDEKVALSIYGAPKPNYGRANLNQGTGVLLHAHSAYTLSRGTIHAGELPAIAAEKGYDTVLLADKFSLVGAREFYRTAQEIGTKALIGATVEMETGGDLVLVAQNRLGYRSLSRLITECHLNEPRLYPLCNWDRLSRHTEGLICLTGGSLGAVDLLVLNRRFDDACALVDRLVGLYGRGSVYVQIERSYLPWQKSVEHSLTELAERYGLKCVPGGPINYSQQSSFPVHDVLVCVDSLCLVEETEGRKPLRDETQLTAPAIPRRSFNAEQFLRSYCDLESKFKDSPDLLQNAKTLANKCEHDVLPGRAELPTFCQDEDTMLRQIVEAGAMLNYRTIKPALKKRINIELNRMTKLGWSRHFLIAWEMCEWAKSQNILLSGRGSVVDSVVAYCLGISRIDAFSFNLYFDRFLPPDGSKRPDIDIDFEAARREDVRQHLVQKYGDEHVATVAAIGTYRSRGIIREVGKVMGIPSEHLSFLAKKLHGSVSPKRLEEALESRPELRDSAIPKERYHWVFKLAEEMMDLPRNLRAHSSGVVLSSEPVRDYVPVQYSGADGVKIIQWDKRSAKYSFDKFDVLCLRGNDVLGGTQRKSGKQVQVTDVPLDDPEVYRTMRAGQLIGIPQSASPAMRQAHIRIGTSNLKDAGIVQAGIRPGVGGAVKLNEYVARRHGKPFRYIHENLEKILSPTLGIVVFQEQVDQLLEEFGGYTGDEAEAIREAIQKYARNAKEASEHTGILDRIVQRGYPRHVAKEVYQLISGFRGYGFAEGHALAFAEISVRSIYCQQNFPAFYFAALLDAQPAGYYGPITIANEARIRGVKILGPDINLSGNSFIVEDVVSDQDPKMKLPDSGIRVALTQIQGLSSPCLHRIISGQPYVSFYDFVTRANPAQDELESLVLAGCFDSFTPNRRALLWSVAQALSYGKSQRGRTYTLPHMLEEPPIYLDVPDFTVAEKAIHERKILGMDICCHLMAFERARVKSKGGLTANQASQDQGQRAVFCVGNPIRLRFPPTQSGKRVMFFDLEDETGLLNVTCFDDVYQRDGHKVICHPYVTIWGETQNRDGHIAFLAHRIHAYRPQMQGLEDPLAIPITIGDFLMS